MGCQVGSLGSDLQPSIGRCQVDSVGDESRCRTDLVHRNCERRRTRHKRLHAAAKGGRWRDGHACSGSPRAFELRTNYAAVRVRQTTMREENHCTWSNGQQEARQTSSTTSMWHEYVVDCSYKPLGLLGSPVSGCSSRHVVGNNATGKAVHRTDCDHSYRSCLEQYWHHSI